MAEASRTRRKRSPPIPGATPLPALPSQTRFWIPALHHSPLLGNQYMMQVPPLLHLLLCIQLRVSRPQQPV